MAKKPTPDVPPYRIHKGSGQAYVTLDGKRRYLGRGDAPDAKQRYDRIIAEWLAGGRRLTPDIPDLSVVELTAAFMRYASDYYAPPSKEAEHFGIVVGMLNALYGDSDAARFGPKRFKAVRECMIGKGWNRVNVNKQAVRLRRVFKWAAESELIPASVFHALQAVAGLKRGRCKAPEGDPVRPVAEIHIHAVCQHLPPDVVALLQLQLLTAARPGELVIMRPIDIDTGGQVWLYRPTKHKTAYRGHTRTIYLGPKAQAVVAPFLAECATDGYLFSPKRAEDWRHTHCKTHRRDNQKSNGRKTKRVIGDHYSANSYRRCVQRACEESKIPVFTMHSIRHTAGTRIRKEFGLEAAQLLLGHAKADVTQVYAEVDSAKAVEVARKIG